MEVMIRQHQFYKVELAGIVEPTLCADELERMTNCATDILDQLKLPYRKVLLCSGDMGFSAEKHMILKSIPQKINIEKYLAAPLAVPSKHGE